MDELSHGRPRDLYYVRVSAALVKDLSKSSLSQASCLCIGPVIVIFSQISPSTFIKLMKWITGPQENLLPRQLSDHVGELWMLGRVPLSVESAMIS